MKDSLGYPIAEGDILIQGSGEWGVYVYEVRDDPDQTKRLSVFDLWMDNLPKRLSKNPKYYINISAVFGDVFTNEEIKKRLTDKHEV